METNTSKKQRTIALLLAIFLGGFGAHRFYVRKPGTAVIIFLLTITFWGTLISVPWIVIDIIMICLGYFKDKEGAILANW